MGDRTCARPAIGGTAPCFATRPWRIRALSLPADAINQRLYEQLGSGNGADPSDSAIRPDGASGRIQQVSGQLYLSRENLDADVISAALAAVLDQQQTAGQAVAVQRGPRLNFEIHFKKNSAELTDESRRGLDELGSVLEESYPEIRFVLGGHTDLDGDASVNDPLSQARADSARSYLIEQHDIDPSRLVARGFGTSDPLRPVEETPQDKLYNRRVDLRPMRESP